MMIVPSAFSRRAFTLIELLVVISIIAILMTLLFPAASSALEAAKRNQAKNDATQIAAAIGTYLSEYGKFPVDGGNNINDATLMNLLAGQNVGQNNPREMVFLEVPRSKSKKNGADSNGGSFVSGYRDSWSNLYEIRIDNEGGDQSYDNKIEGPEGTGTIHKSVIVWSKGNPKGSGYNDVKKYIKSWE